MTKSDMQDWVKKQWYHILQYNPKVSLLMSGWFVIHFLHHNDVEHIRKSPWVSGRSFLKLHRWYVGFNPLSETSRNRYIWVKFSGLSLEFWTRSAIKEIGNAIRCLTSWIQKACALLKNELLGCWWRLTSLVASLRRLI